MSVRPTLSITLLGAVLAAGCAPLGVSRPWDPDRPVLPVRLARPQADTSKTRLPASYVVLLAEDDGASGAVLIDRPGGRLVLDRPGLASLDAGAPSSAGEVLPAPEPSPVFAEALAFEPRAPASFEIYFPSDGSQPTADSLVRLEKVLEALRDWPAAEISLAGYADRSGSARHNEELSRRRAEAIRDALVAAGARADLVELGWHGEAGAAVPTADGVREARNRRVEIRIR